MTVKRPWNAVLSLGMRGDPLLELLLGHVRRIEPRPGGFGCVPRNGSSALEAVPRPLVDREVAEDIQGFLTAGDGLQDRDPQGGVLLG